MKKLLSILIAIALMLSMSVTAFAAEEPTLYVAGVAVTSDNLEINSADNGAITGSATYDPTTNTLTLDNFSYTGEGYKYDDYSSAAIYTRNDFIVNLVGSNTLNCTDVGIRVAGLTIQGNDKETDTLTVISKSNNIYAGNTTISNATITAQAITATGNLAITGSIVNIGDNGSGGSIYAYENLNISSSTINLNADYGGLGANEKLTITESTITTAEGKCTFIGSSGAMEIVDSEVTVAEEGIAANDSLTIRNSTVTVTATGTNFGIAVDGGDMSVSGSSTVTATGTNFGIAVIGGDMSVSDSSTVTATGANFGIAVMGSMSVSGSSTVTATGGELALCMMDDEGNPVPLVPTFTGDYAVYAGEVAPGELVTSPTTSTYNSKYVKIAPAEPETETKSTTITYDVAPTYTVTIPATVVLGETATISAENVVVPKGKQVEVALTNANGFTVATPQGAELGYTVKNGETTVNEGDTVLTVNPDGGKTGETTLKFVAPETVKFAGDYTGTVTFTIAVKDVPTISFTLDTSYIEEWIPGLTANLQAEAGMTWGEWMESEYNVDGYVPYTLWDGTVVVSVPNEDWAIADGGYPNCVEYTDEIIANHTYDFSITGG